MSTTTTTNHHTAGHHATSQLAGRGNATEQREWETFTTWCGILDLDLGAVTFDVLADYARTRAWAAATARSRVRYLVARLADEGVWIEPETPSRPNVVHEGPGLRTPEQILADLPMLGWPHGFTDRRDAFLLVLLGPLGMSRAQVRALHPRDIELTEKVRPGGVIASPAWSIAGRLAAHGETLASCSQCQITLWLGVWSAWISGFRRGVDDWLLARQGYWGHVCDDAADEAGTVWRTEPVLLPGIDARGWPSMETLSARQISRIVAKHQTSGPECMTPRPPQRSPRPLSISFGRRVDIDADGSLSDAMDRLEAATDAVMDRMKNLMSRL